MHEYTIATAKNLGELTGKINALAQDGWKVKGGVSFDTDQYGEHQCCALLER